MYVSRVEIVKMSKIAWPSIKHFIYTSLNSIFKMMVKHFFSFKIWTLMRPLITSRILMGHRMKNGAGASACSRKHHQLEDQRVSRE